MKLVSQWCKRYIMEVGFEPRQSGSGLYMLNRYTMLTLKNHKRQYIIEDYLGWRNIGEE